MTTPAQVHSISNFLHDGKSQAQQRQQQPGATSASSSPLPPADSQLNQRFNRQLAISVVIGGLDRKEAARRCEQAHVSGAEAFFDQHIAAQQGRQVQARREAKEAQLEADEVKAQRDQYPKLRRQSFNADALHKKPYNPRDIVEVLLMVAAIVISMMIGINTVAHIVMSDFGFSQSLGRARAYGAVLFVLPTFAIATFSGLAKDDAKRLRLIRFYTILGFIGLFSFIITFALAKTPIPTTADPLDMNLDMDVLTELSPEQPWWKSFVKSLTEFINEVRPLLNLPLTICMAISEIFFAVTVKSILLRKLDIHGWPYRPKAEIVPEYAALDGQYRAAQRTAATAEAAWKDCEQSLRHATEQKKRYCEQVTNLALADFTAQYAQLKVLQQ